MRIKTILFLSLLALSSCSENNQNGTHPSTNSKITSEQNNIYYYNSENTNLKGTLVYKTYWGPPNYGEDTLTDSKETFPILELITPIKVLTDSNNRENEPKEGITEIQVVSKIELTEFRNKKVSIKGKLFSGISGHHHTEILIEMKEIK